MRKIFVTSIGSGKDRNSGTYDLVTYTMGGEELLSPYIAEALASLTGIDHLILFGTRTSDWMSFFEYLQISDHETLKGDELTEEQLKELENNIRQAQNEKITPCLDDAESLLLKAFQGVTKAGTLLNVILLTFGVTDEEISENFMRMRKIERHLDAATAQEPISLYFDITHSFRTHPMFELLFMNYIVDVRRIRHVAIEMVTYAMRDRNTNTVPIVNVARLNTMLECMQAVEEFQRSGTVYKLVELSERGRVAINADALEQLKSLTDTVYINRRSTFQNLINYCRGRVRENVAAGDEVSVFLNQIYKEIADTFTETDFSAVDGNIMTRYQLAKWHCGKKRYINAAIAMAEAMKVYCFRLCEEHNTRIEYRLLKEYSDAMLTIGDRIKTECRERRIDPYSTHGMFFQGLDDETCRFMLDYSQLHRLRNSLCHEADNEFRKPWETLTNIINSRTKVQRFFANTEENRQRRAALRECLKALC